jgi:uncharacterized protein
MLKQNPRRTMLLVSPLIILAFALSMTGGLGNAFWQVVDPTETPTPALLDPAQVTETPDPEVSPEPGIDLTTTPGVPDPNITATPDPEVSPEPGIDLTITPGVPDPANDLTPTPTLPDPLATPTPGTPIIPETGLIQIPGIQILSEENVRSVTVTGMGQATAQPDTAVIVVGVRTENQNASAALTQNSEQMDTLMNTLTGAGVPMENIQTRSVRLSPLYDFQPRPDGTTDQPLIRGYEAVNTVQVRVDDIDQTGALLDLVVQEGGNIIENIWFEINDRNELIQQARQAAIEDAREKAEQLAQLTGTSLGIVISINETTMGIPRPFAQQEFAADAAMAVPIAPGEQEVIVSLTVTWAITGGQQGQ